MLCSKERKLRLLEREKKRQLTRKKDRKVKSMAKLYNAYRSNIETKNEIAKQTYHFACLSAQLWMNGLTVRQIAGIYNSTVYRVSKLIFLHFPKLGSEEVKKEQLLKTKQNWFECYDLLSNYGVSYQELETFLNTFTHLSVSQPMIKKEMLAIKKLLEEGAEYDEKKDCYSFKQLNLEK